MNILSILNRKTQKFILNVCNKNLLHKRYLDLFIDKKILYSISDNRYLKYNIKDKSLSLASGRIDVESEISSNLLSQVLFAAIFNEKAKDKNVNLCIDNFIDNKCENQQNILLFGLKNLNTFFRIDIHKLMEDILNVPHMMPLLVYFYVMDTGNEEGNDKRYRTCIDVVYFDKEVPLEDMPSDILNEYKSRLNGHFKSLYKIVSSNNKISLTFSPMISFVGTNLFYLRSNAFIVQEGICISN